MSEEQDNTKPKRGRGRPKGSKTTPPQRQVAFTMTMAEAIREGVDPRFIRKYHLLITANVNPVTQLDKQGNIIDIIPDPSPLAQTPTLQQKTDSWKFLTAYGWGQPVQSHQIDAEFRAKIDQLGSGIPTQELMGLDPAVLFKLAEALKVPLLENVTDAELVDDNGEPVENNGAPNTNSPLPSPGSEPIS